MKLVVLSDLRLEFGPFKYLREKSHRSHEDDSVDLAFGLEWPDRSLQERSLTRRR